MKTFYRKAIVGWLLGTAFALTAGTSTAQQMPVMEAVVGNNFGHLPMFVGVEKGLFKKHGVDVKLKVVNIGSQMVTAMQKNVPALPATKPGSKDLKDGKEAKVPGSH